MSKTPPQHYRCVEAWCSRNLNHKLEVVIVYSLINSFFMNKNTRIKTRWVTVLIFCSNSLTLEEEERLEATLRDLDGKFHLLESQIIESLSTLELGLVD